MSIITIVQSQHTPASLLVNFLSMDCNMQYFNIPLNNNFLGLVEHLWFLGPVFNQWEVVLCVFLITL